MKRGTPLTVFFSTLLMVAFSVQPSFAYNPPVDSAGPLKVTIEGPEEVTEIGTALPVKVTLENSGDGQLTGTLRLAVIDRWTVEPAGAVPFTVAPKGKASLDFKGNRSRPLAVNGS